MIGYIRRICAALREAEGAELNAHRQISRLRAWQERADAWEHWANATGGSIPQSFLNEVEQIQNEQLHPRKG